MFIALKPGPDIDASGLLPVGGVQSLDLRGATFPVTVSLVSSNAGRKIELGPDGANWYAPVLDATGATFISVAIMAPVAYVRVTGAAGDAWGLQ